MIICGAFTGASTNSALRWNCNYWNLQADRIELRAVNIEGSALETTIIKSYAYPRTRPLYGYVKNQGTQDNPEIAAYLAEFTSEAAIGQNSGLVQWCLVRRHLLKVSKRSVSPGTTAT